MPSPIQAFGLTRAAVGALAWLSPTLASRVFGLDPASRQPMIT